MLKLENTKFFFKKKKFNNKYVNLFIISRKNIINKHIRNTKVFLLDTHKSFKLYNTFKSKKKHNVLNTIKLIEFLEFLIKKNFAFYIIANKLSINVLSIIKYIINFKFKYEKFHFYKFYSSFILNFSFFLHYRNPNILLQHLTSLSKYYSFKVQRQLHRLLFKLVYTLKSNFIHSVGLLGFMIKIKGKYTQRPGDRRKVFFYKFLKYSLSNPRNKYYISHAQLRNKSGASGCTIIVLLM